MRGREGRRRGGRGWTYLHRRCCSFGRPSQAVIVEVNKIAGLSTYASFPLPLSSAPPSLPPSLLPSSHLLLRAQVDESLKVDLFPNKLDLRKVRKEGRRVSFNACTQTWATFLSLLTNTPSLPPSLPTHILRRGLAQVPRPINPPRLNARALHRRQITNILHFLQLDLPGGECCCGSCGGGGGGGIGGGGGSGDGRGRGVAVLEEGVGRWEGL